jgi:IclR family pca regulon transcriptional regulator
MAACFVVLAFDKRATWMSAIGQRTKPLTSKTIVDVGDVRKAIVKAARDGFAMDHEETEAGLRRVAAPIRDGSGRVRAAMSVSAPTTRLRAQVLEEIRVALMKNATEAGAKINPLARDSKRVSGAA